MKKVESREHSPSQPADRRALAEINDLIDGGVYEAASVMAWDVQRDTPDDPAIWLILTRIDYLRERYAAAMYAARMATRLDPSSVEAWLWLARTGATRARWRTEALDAALQATALGPDDPRTWTVLAELHLASDARYEAAIAAERAVRVGPTDVAAHRTLGAIALQASEWQHATAAFRRTLELDADDDQARAGLAEALRAQDIDPAEEQSRSGAVYVDRRGVADRVGRVARRLAKDNLDLSDPGPLQARRRGLVIGVAVCVALGALGGLAMPWLGPVRGFVAAAALALMWVAIWPMRRTRPVPATSQGVRSDTSVVRTGPPDRLGKTGARQAAPEGETVTSTNDAQRTAPAVQAPRSDHPRRSAPVRPPDVERSAELEKRARRSKTDRPAEAATEDQPAAAETHEEQEGARAAGTATPRARAMRARADRTRFGRMIRAPERRDTATSKPPATSEEDRPEQATTQSADSAKRTADQVNEQSRDAAMTPVEQPPEAGERKPDRRSKADDPPASTGTRAIDKSADAAERPAEVGTQATNEPTDQDVGDALPSDPAELVALSASMLAEYNLETARAAAERLAEVAPDSLEAHRVLGAVSLAEQDYAQAEVHYGHVLEIEPLDQEAHERLAVAKKGRRGEERPWRRRRRKG